MNGTARGLLTLALVVSMCLSLLPLVAMDIGATPIPPTISTPMTITTDTNWDSGTSTISANITVQSPATLRIANLTINIVNNWTNSTGGGGHNKSSDGASPFLDFTGYFGFKVESGAKLIIYNSTIQGKTKNDRYNIVSEGTVNIQESIFKNLDTDGIYVDGSSVDPIIKGNTFSGGNDALRLNNVKSNVNNNTFTDVGSYGMHITNSDLTIRDNTFSGTNNAIYGTDDTCTIELNEIEVSNEGIELSSSQCTIRNNTVHSNNFAYLGINVYDPNKSYDIYDNEIYSVYYAIQVSGSADVFKNSIHDCDQGIMIYPSKGGGGGGGAQVVWNNLTTIRYQGINAYDAINAVIENNTIMSTGSMFDTGTAINIGGMSNGLVADNKISDVSGYGIGLHEGAYNMMFNNNQISDVDAGNQQQSYTGAVNIESTFQGSTWSFYPNEFTFDNVAVAFRATEASDVNLYGWDLTGKGVGTTSDFLVLLGNWADTNVYLWDTFYDDYTVDEGQYKYGNSVQASFTVYWSCDFSATWESDGSPVDMGTLTVTDTYGDQAFQGDTDLSGYVGPFFLPQLSESKIYLQGNGTTTTTMKDFSPFTYQFQKDLKGRTYANETSAMVKGQTSVSLMLDDVPPFIEITAPVDGFLTNQTWVIVQGMTEVLSYVIINGVVADVYFDGGFEATVPLDKEGKNTLTVSVTDKGKNERWASINVTRDTITPELTMTAPEQNAIFNKMAVVIKGTTEPGANLTVLGKVVTVAQDGSWNTTVTYTKEGPNSVTVVSRDMAGNSVSMSRTFIIDITPPNLIIGRPLNNTLTKNPSMEVSGSVEKDCTVNVNGKKIIYDGSLFSATVELVDGTNVITVTATDVAGNSNTVKVTVVRDSTPPALDVKSPTDNLRTSKFSIIVNGTTEKGAIVKINSIEVPNKNGTFSDTVFLNDGSNKITVEATDAAGNTATKVRKVFKEAGGTADPVTVTSPANGTVVSGSSVTLSGSLNELGILTVNGQRVTADTNDNFEYTVNLNEGKNNIALTLTDSFGNNFTLTWTIIRDTTPPEITITSPKSKVDQANVLVQGKTEPGATVTVNGLMVYVSATGDFTAPATLNPGKNKIYVTAVDKVGNPKTVTVDVKYEPAGGAVGLGTASGMTLGLVALLIILVVIIMVLLVMMMSRMGKGGAKPRTAMEEIDEGEVKEKTKDEDEPELESLDEDEPPVKASKTKLDTKAPTTKPPPSKPLPPPLPSKKPGNVNVEVKK